MFGRDVEALILEELWRTHRASSRHVGAKLDLLIGCTLPQFLALRAIVSSEGIMLASDVAKVMGCTRWNISPIVRRLHELGWITKSENPWDGRAVSLRATPSGRRNCEMLAEEVDRAVRVIFGPLIDEEKETLLELLRKITGADVE
jgi:DNA-binding MarR family transcriptional regulator